MRIAIGVPVGEIVKAQTVGAISVMAYHIGRNGHDFRYFSEKGPYVDANANNIFKRAQECEADYLMMVETDLDNMSGGDVISRFMSYNADIVSGIYYRGVYPYRPIIHCFTDKLGELLFPGEFPTEEPFYIDMCGSGFQLISKKVLDAFTPEVKKELGEPFDFLIKDNEIIWRNDIAFCWRLKKLGFKVLIDPTVKLGHIKEVSVTSSHWEASRQHMVETGKVVV